jgi:predicted GNAT family acetyltransferase
MSADIDSTDIEITDNPDQDRYEVRSGGQVIGRADYRRDGNQIVIPHTPLDPAHRGQGLGGQMVRYALDDIRARDLKVVPACPFVSDYLARHPEYADIL